MQADRDHRTMWSDLLKRQAAKHAAEIERLRETIEGQRRELADRPERIVVRHIGTDEITAAQAEAERAFRSRETAWRALVEVRLLHREGTAGSCRCGLRLDRCAVAGIVERYPALRTWEDEQVGRLRRGDTFNLPDTHPAVLDRRPTGRP